MRGVIIRAMGERVCLVVDDEPAIRAFLRTVLGTRNIHCVEAESGCEALRTIHRLNGQIDLVITDVRMPGDMNGIDLAHSLRYKFPKVPVVLMSGSAEEEQRAQRAGRLFLTKPVSVATVLKTIEDILPGAEESTESA